MEGARVSGEGGEQNNLSFAYYLEISCLFLKTNKLNKKCSVIFRIVFGVFDNRNFCLYYVTKKKKNVWEYNALL